MNGWFAWYPLLFGVGNDWVLGLILCLFWLGPFEIKLDWPFVVGSSLFRLEARFAEDDADWDDDWWTKFIIDRTGVRYWSKFISKFTGTWGAKNKWGCRKRCDCKNPWINAKYWDINVFDIEICFVIINGQIKRKKIRLLLDAWIIIKFHVK